MNHSTDWLPNTRTGKLTMCLNWVDYLNMDVQDSEGKTVKRYAAWGMPEEVFSTLMTDFDTARRALEAAQNDELRTKPVNEACRLAFEALDKTMRMVKDYYVKVPPLTTVDVIALGLKPRDKKPTPHGAPKLMVTATLSNPQPGSILLRIKPWDEGLGHDKDADHVMIRFGILLPGGATPEQIAEDRLYLAKVPVSPGELPEPKTTMRMKELLDLGLKYRGCRIFFSLRYENAKGDPGPWCPIIEGVIT